MVREGEGHCFVLVVCAHVVFVEPFEIVKMCTLLYHEKGQKGPLEEVTSARVILFCLTVFVKTGQRDFWQQVHYAMQVQRCCWTEEHWSSVICLDYNPSLQTRLTKIVLTVPWLQESSEAHKQFLPTLSLLNSSVNVAWRCKRMAAFFRMFQSEYCMSCILGYTQCLLHKCVQCLSGFCEWSPLDWEPLMSFNPVVWTSEH